MIIDLRDIKRQGKDSLDFFFELALDNQLIDIPNVTFDGPIRINGTATLTGEHSAVIEGDIEFSLVGECTSCLSSAKRSFCAEFYEDFGMNSDNGNCVKGDKIDLTEVITSAVLTEMPYGFLCKDECLGLCPICGTNLNENKCDCKNK